MSKAILLIIAILVLISFIPATVAPLWYGSGNDTLLVARWSCENNFKDSSGYGNHGTQSGGVTITRGVKGRGCGFDGVDDYINLPDVASIKFNNRNFTVTGWVYYKNCSRTYPSILLDGAWNFGLGIDNPTSRIELWYDNVRSAFSNTAVPINAWSFVALTYNGTNSTFYLNGVADGITGIAPPTLVTGHGFIGGGAADSFFNGTIDELRIYNRSLSPSEISTLYNTTKTYKIVMKTTPTQGIVDETGLVGYWKFNREDGSNSTTTIDSSAYGRNGIVTGATFTNEGRFKEGYKFDGTNDWIYLPLKGTNNVSISAWIKPLEFTTGIYHTIVRSDGNPSFFTYGGTVYCYIGVGIQPTQAISGTNAWHHVACNYNGTDAIVYVDGVAGAPVSGIASFTQTRFAIGSGHWGTVEFFNGSIDEVRIYNRSLSASEVAALYNGTKSNYIRFKTTPDLGLLNDTPAPTASDETGLVGYWKMDDLTNGNTTDSSGRGNNGSVVGASFTNNGRWNNAFSYDGSADSIVVSNLGIPQNANASISMWININQSAVSRGAYNDLIIGVAGSTFSFYQHSANNFLYLTGADYFGIAPTINTWHHIVLTWAGNTSSALLYYDGTAYSSTIQGISDNIGAISYASIGYSDANSFLGKIDEVKMYNRTLSSSEVQELYLSKGLVGYWKMNDDQKNTTDTYDDSGYNNHGKISGAILTNEGKFREGYKFDGVNDYINISYAEYNLTANFTISAWAKTVQMGTLQGIITKTPTADQNSGYRLGRSSDGKLIFLIGNGTAFDYVYSNSVYNDTNWHHIAMTNNGADTRFYVDGAMQTDYSSYRVAANTRDVMIGRFSAPSARYTWNGTIDEVRIYNRALTSQEVAGLYNGTKSNFIQFYTVPG